ncbi:hypothetical protein BX600DRAFT_513922 [Xylariales sp. PMI_506]|nr:hypothetical protein BX600DRAFT_513922 [Xylariales sp. PMI_506]
MAVHSTAPPAAPIANIVSPTNQLQVAACIETLSNAFLKVPCTYAFSTENLSTPTENAVRSYVHRVVRQSLRSGATLVEAGGNSAVALWELPYQSDMITTNHSFDEISDGLTKKEWKEAVRSAKEKYIGLEPLQSGFSSSERKVRPHYHLDFLGRDPSVPKVPGAISAVVTPFLDRAKQDGLKVWLEATSPEVAELYEHYGFKILEEITVGQGRVDANGGFLTGGPGVKAWLMLVDNHAET